VLAVSRPQGAFYLWVSVPGDDVRFARALFERAHLTVLPGSFMAREVDGQNPGRNHVRISMVPPLAQCVQAAERLRRFMARDAIHG
jgi:N-succinyldiaminopimelate aminotransferase